MTAALAAAVERSVAGMGGFGGSYPVFVAPPPGGTVVSAADVLAPDALRQFFTRAVAEWSASPEAEDIKAAGSRFMRRYIASVAAAALVPLSEGVAVDVSISRVAFVIRNEMPMGIVVDLTDRITTSPARPTTWPVRGHVVDSVEALRERAWRSLFADHVVPALTSVRESVKLARALLWTTVAEQLRELYWSAIPAALAAGDHVRHRVLTNDYAAITEADELPGVDGTSPLRHRLSEEPSGEPGLPPLLPIRRICCTCYIIPGRNTYCRSCPLVEPAERVQMWRSFVARS